MRGMVTAKQLEEFVALLAKNVSTHKIAVTIQTPRAKNRRTVVAVAFDPATASLVLVAK